MTSFNPGDRVDACKSLNGALAHERAMTDEGHTRRVFASHIGETAGSRWFTPSAANARRAVAQDGGTGRG